MRVSWVTGKSSKSPAVRFRGIATGDEKGVPGKEVVSWKVRNVETRTGECGCHMAYPAVVHHAAMNTKDVVAGFTTLNLYGRFACSCFR